jgi:hypothetical protein
MQTRRTTVKQPEPATRSYRQDELQSLLARDPRAPSTWNTATVAFGAIATLGASTDSGIAKGARAAGDDRARSHKRIRSAALVLLALAAGAAVSLLATGDWDRTRTLQLRAQGADPQQARAASTAIELPGAAPGPEPAPATGLGPDTHAQAVAAEVGSQPAATRAPSNEHSFSSQDVSGTPKAPPKELAIAALAAGREREAIAAYRALANAEPQKPVFATIAAILEHRLMARCKQLRDSETSACAASSP